MLRSILRIANAQRDAFTTAVVNEAEVLGPKLVAAGVQIAQFAKREEQRSGRIAEAYQPYVERFEAAVEKLGL